MLDSIQRFDMVKPPERQHLRPLIWALSFPTLLAHGNKLEKIGMDGIKPPYLLLCNHNAFMDFMVATKAVFPHRANYVVAIDGFLKREWLLRFIGCICKRKFTSDLLLVRHLQRVVARGDIPVIYPEARYSLCGTTAVLPESLGKLVKFLKIPLVVLICNGHHVNSPFWNLPDHRVRGTRATMTCLMHPDEIAAASADAINEAIRDAFIYDDFKWQKDSGIRIEYPNRAKGLHKVLYQCPACGKEYRMASDGTVLKCEACGKEWEMSALGELKAKTGDTEFSHIPDWYEWERQNVRDEILRGEYRLSAQARVDALPNAEGYIDIGEATLTHDLHGFVLEGDCMGEHYRVEVAVPSLYSCHVEYEYLGRFGDCIDLNTNTDTLYIYPMGRDSSVTKIALATEELYQLDSAGMLNA